MHDIDCKPSILLVEDQEISRKVVILILSDLNCEVTAARSGQEALELFNHNSYDIVLIDIGLPDISGLKVAEEIRNTKNAKANVPIAVISAYSSSKYIEKANLIGLNDFIIKPICKENLEQLINKHIYSNRVKSSHA